MSHAANIASALRAIAPGGKLLQAEIPHVDAIAALWEARVQPMRTSAEPAWTTHGRGAIGQREIPGPQDNPWIIRMWERVGITWFRSEDVAWCAGFQAWCMVMAGIEPPPKAVLAGAGNWAPWGVPCQPQVGAIAVKSRVGGNHVCQLVGITPDGRFYKCLGGNQSNGVNITDIPVTTNGRPTFHAIRWPNGVPQMNIPLPILPAGTVSGSEA